MAHDAIGRAGRDKITGFTGTIIAHVDYISGCSQFLIAPSVDSSGKKSESEWFDEQRVEVSGEALTLPNASTPGCDMPAPVR